MCTFLALSIQHHFLCLQLFGHCDDGRSHQTSFPLHVWGAGHPGVQSFRWAVELQQCSDAELPVLIFDFVSSSSALSYGLLCLAMAYLTHLMGDSVLQVSSPGVRPNPHSDLNVEYFVLTSGGFENLRDGWWSNSRSVLSRDVLSMCQLHSKLSLWSL